MSTIPPEGPAGGPEPPYTPPAGPGGQPPGGYVGPGYGGLGRGPTTGAILPVPGNAELAVYVLATVVLAIIWAASDQLEAHGFSWIFGTITAAYLISRGLAKATRVLEQ